MTTKGMALVMVGAAVFAILGTLAVYAAAAYVALHFIHKLW